MANVKLIVYSDDIYIKTIYLASRTDLIHMLRNFFVKNRL